MAADTIPARFLTWAHKTPERPAYYNREGGQWQATTWATHVAQTRRAARALIALDFKPADTVAIIGVNRPEWVIFDMAAVLAGGVPAGIYTTSSPSELAYIVNHAEAAFLLVENNDQWQKVHAQRQNLPLLRHVIFMKGTTPPEDPLCLSWEEFLAHGDVVEERVIEERVEGLKLEAPATFIYTSGTTGPPKAVMLSHRNLVWTAGSTAERIGVTQDERVISYLPLSHVAEQMFTIHGSAVSGMAPYFAPSIDNLREDIASVRPTLFFGVPRVWEKFYEAIRPRLAEGTPIRRSIVAWARRVGLEVSRFRMVGQQPTGALAAQYAVAKKLVFSKVHERAGFDQARLIVSGAAPITREVMDFFASLDLLIQEIYGQSETSGPTSFNRAGAIRLGSVGQPIPDVEVRIADDGEILTRGPNTFIGYFKDPKATSEALVDGWLHTGDLGAFDANGFLSITGRKKEIIITAGGKNISPKNIEEAIKEIPLVNEAVVIGDRRKYLVALVSLKADAAQKFATEHKLTGALPDHPLVVAEIQKGLDRVNKDLARVEGIRKFKVLHRDFSLEAGELTPTLKTRRSVIAKNFAVEIESLYVESVA
jgi:long-chain acyl-CoA synthetase